MTSNARAEGEMATVKKKGRKQRKVIAAMTLRGDGFPPFLNSILATSRAQR